MSLEPDSTETFWLEKSLEVPYCVARWDVTLEMERN